MARKRIRRRFKLIRKKRLVEGYFLLELLIQQLMKNGKKTLIKYYLKKIIQKLKEKTSFNFLYVFETALKNLSPNIKLISKFSNKKKKIEDNSSVSSSLKYKSIIEISIYESTKIALNWLIKGARLRNSKDMISSLTSEIFEAFHKKGNAMKQRLLVYEQAKFLKINKIF